MSRCGGVRQRCVRDGVDGLAGGPPAVVGRRRGRAGFLACGPAALRGLGHRPQCGVRHIPATRGVR
ncbi:hypothetical protein SGM_0467 [Streptomyces griseoaurantiacus M045]|uniref:Uncharacterized protein n=1 Tax=Streptomyces griseoaurantiacus M045 TaxID=996637 RepID=F3NAT3_9ACTN|nr:hypothetical protein SGM_0467 [Streptomyces griseoaurantiacus M045]